MNTGKRECLLMQFEKIDRETWPRREYFEHYFGAVPCTYSMTVKLDITPILESGRKLYPSLLYYLTTIVNRHAEFRRQLPLRRNLLSRDQLRNDLVQNKFLYEFSPRNLFDQHCNESLL